jgi:hypothetical protein
LVQRHKTAKNNPYHCSCITADAADINVYLKNKLNISKEFAEKRRLTQMLVSHVAMEVMTSGDKHSRFFFVVLSSLPF